MTRRDVIFFVVVFLWIVSGIYCIVQENGELVYSVDLVWTAVLIAVIVAGRISRKACRWLDREL